MVDDWIQRTATSALLLFLALSWTLAAFGEEICLRGFLMKRMADLLGGSRAAWITSLFVSSALFGWGHTEQGVAGWIQEGLSGFLLGVLFLLAGRNLVIPGARGLEHSCVRPDLLQPIPWPGLNSADAGSWQLS
jgi:membrane protease YdiL (CAAX protease family)